jgi:hypothetical protein
MLKLVLENIDVFPAWLKTFIAVTWGIMLIVLPLYISVKILQKEEMKSTFSFLSTKVISFLNALQKTLQKELDDPIKHPRFEYYLNWLNVVFSYLLSLVLLLVFLILMLAFLFNAKNLSFYQHAVFFCFALLTLITAKAIKAHAGRDLIKLQAHKKAK